MFCNISTFQDRFCSEQIQTVLNDSSVKVDWVGLCVWCVQTMGKLDVRLDITYYHIRHLPKGNHLLSKRKRNHLLLSNRINQECTVLQGFQWQRPDRELPNDLGCEKFSTIESIANKKLGSAKKPLSQQSTPKSGSNQAAKECETMNWNCHQRGGRPAVNKVMFFRGVLASFTFLTILVFLLVVLFNREAVEKPVDKEKCPFAQEDYIYWSKKYQLAWCKVTVTFLKMPPTPLPCPVKRESR